MKQIDLKDQYFGTEIEMTGISRYDAAVAIGRMFGTEPYHIRSYDSWCVKDSDGKTWKFSRDSSIDCERLANGTVIDADGDYSTEMVSPKLEYSEMGKLQEVVRCVKNAGAFVNSSCGMHVHVDASNHTPRSLKNALTIMYCKEDILFKALNVQTRREDEYCQKVRPMVLEKIRRMPNSTITMESFLIGLIMVFFGNGYLTMVTGLVGGLLADVILKKADYKSAKSTVLSCGVFSIWVFGNFAPIFLNRESYMVMLTEGYGAEYAATLNTYMPMWIAPILLVACFVFGLVGGMIGKAICKKHFQRAGIA